MTAGGTGLGLTMAAPTAAAGMGGAGGLLAGAAPAASFAPSATGLFGSGVTGTQLMGGLDSVGKAAGAVGAANSMFPSEKPQPAQLQPGNPAGPQTVAQIYQASQQNVQDQIDKAMQARQQRRQNWG
jgi:hypothetical protein